MRKFFRRLRALKYAVEAWTLWPDVGPKLEDLAQNDSMVRDFRDAVDKGWKILRYGKIKK